jgi:hypothetical protein
MERRAGPLDWRPRIAHPFFFFFFFLFIIVAPLSRPILLFIILLAHVRDPARRLDLVHIHSCRSLILLQVEPKRDVIVTLIPKARSVELPFSSSSPFSRNSIGAAAARRKGGVVVVSGVERGISFFFFDERLERARGRWKEVGGGGDDAKVSEVDDLIAVRGMRDGRSPGGVRGRLVAAIGGEREGQLALSSERKERLGRQSHSKGSANVRLGPSFSIAIRAARRVEHGRCARGRSRTEGEPRERP